MAACVQLGAVQPAHDELPLTSKNGMSRNQSRGLCFGCTLQTALLAVLIALVAWLGSTVRDQAASLDALTASSAAPSVMFTLGQPAVDGYVPYGSLFRGSGSWVVKPTLLPSGGISDHGAVSIGLVIYMFGGAAVDPSVAVGASQPLNANMWRYDTIYETYTPLADMPVPYTRFAYAGSDSTVYVVGGLGGDTDIGWCWDGPACSATVPSGVNMATVDDAAGANPGTAGGSTWLYNVAADAWSAGPALNVPRADACAAVVNGKVYVVGGYADGYNITDSLEVMDPSAASPRWTSLPPMPSPRGDLSCASLNGLFYVFGGYYSPTCTNATLGCFPYGDSTAAVNNASNFRTETWSFDPATAAWTARAPMRYARGDAAAVALPDGRIVVAGGEHNMRTLDVKVPQHSVEMYFAAQDVWAEKAPMPFARFRFAAAAVGQRTHAFGGQQICMDNSTGTSMAACQLTAADTHSTFFELDHPDVFVQLPTSAGSGLTFDTAIMNEE